MNDRDINEAIAEACGYVDCGPDWRTPEGKFQQWIPDYCNDLNDMYQAEELFYGQSETIHGAERMAKYSRLLCNYGYPLHTTAHDRAEAFLRTIGEWVES